MGLYADENFPLRVVEELRHLGYDVLTAFDDGKANLAITDRELLARASELDRAVLTLNRLDFNGYICKCLIMRVSLSVRKIRIDFVRLNALSKLSGRQARYDGN